MNPLVKRFKDHMRNKRDPVIIGRIDEPVGMYNSMILSENISMLTDPRIINRNLNTVLFGNDEDIIASYIGPNLMQGGRSFVVMDPDGLIGDRYARYLEYKGYKVKRLDLIHTDRSDHYNPFRYIGSDMDAEKLVISIAETSFFGGYTDRILLTALVSYTQHFEKEENRNFSFVAGLLAAEYAYLDLNRAVNDGADRCSGGRIKGTSPLDTLFSGAEDSSPEAFAVKMYKKYKIAAGSSHRKDTVESCVRKLDVFTLKEIADLTRTDDMDLDGIGDEMTAVFVSAPKGHTVFSPVVSMFFSQFFRKMIDYCENQAEFTRVMTDREGNVIKCFRADRCGGIKKAAKEADEFLKRAKEGNVVFNKTAGRYEVVTSHNELVCFRGSEEDAAKALDSVKRGKIIGRSCPGWFRTPPIQTITFLADFPNSCRIPEFDMLTPILRKWGIIVVIAAESLIQLRATYEDNDEWAGIIWDYDTAIVSGEGCDRVTAEFISKLMTNNKARSHRRKDMTGLPVREVPVPEGCTPDELQKIPEGERIIAIRGANPLIDRKYDETSHPEWDTVVRCQNAGLS